MSTAVVVLKRLCIWVKTEEGTRQFPGLLWNIEQLQMGLKWPSPCPNWTHIKTEQPPVQGLQWARHKTFLFHSTSTWSIAYCWWKETTIHFSFQTISRAEKDQGEQWVREEDGEGLEDEMLILCQGGGQRVGMGFWATLYPTDPRWGETLPPESTIPVGAVEVGSILRECWRQGTGRSSNGYVRTRFQSSVEPWGISPSQPGILIRAAGCPAPPCTPLCLFLTLHISAFSVLGPSVI